MSRRRRTLLAIVVAAVAVAGCGQGGDDAAAPTLDAEIEATGDAEEPTAGDDAGASSDPASATDASASASDGAAPTTDDAGSAEECTVADDESRIELFEPAADAVLDRTFTIAGCGNTFEATYLWELELDDGAIAGSGFGTMTCGSGCVGTFTEEVTADGSGAGVLRVFEEDAAAGGRTNVVEVPVEVSP